MFDRLIARFRGESAVPAKADLPEPRIASHALPGNAPFPFVTKHPALAPRGKLPPAAERLAKVRAFLEQGARKRRADRVGESLEPFGAPLNEDRFSRDWMQHGPGGYAGAKGWEHLPEIWQQAAMAPRASLTKQFGWLLPALAGTGAATTTE